MAADQFSTGHYSSKVITKMSGHWTAIQCVYLKKMGAPALDGEWSSIISGRYDNMYVERVAMVT